jgi:hypothetical protein
MKLCNIFPVFNKNAANYKANRFLQLYAKPRVIPRKKLEAPVIIKITGPLVVAGPTIKYYL